MRWWLGKPMAAGVMLLGGGRRKDSSVKHQHESGISGGKGRENKAFLGEEAEEGSLCSELCLSRRMREPAELLLDGGRGRHARALCLHRASVRCTSDRGTAPACLSVRQKAYMLAGGGTTGMKGVGGRRTCWRPNVWASAGGVSSLNACRVPFVCEVRVENASKLWERMRRGGGMSQSLRRRGNLSCR